MSHLLIVSGVILSLFFNWLDRGMYAPGQAGLGIILFSLWSTVAFLLFFSPRIRLPRSLPEWIWPLFLGAALLLLIIDSRVMYGGLVESNPILLMKGPIRVFSNNLAYYLLLTIWLCFGFLLGTVVFRKSPKIQSLLACLVFGSAAITHLLILRLVPFPFIDVFTVISEATVGLLEGRNPYQISYIDIYQGQGVTPSEFVYLPGLFPWALAGMVFMGDVRAGNFLALVGIALIFLVSCKSRRGIAIFFLAALLFVGGAGLFVAEQAWIDPILAFLIFASFWLLVKGRLVFSAVLSGLFCATKQYGVIAFCFLLVLALNREGWGSVKKFFILAFSAGLFVQLPFFFWGFKEYWNTVVVGVGLLPFRSDSYTLLSLLTAYGIPITGITFIGPLVVLALVWQCRRLRIIEPEIILLAVSVAYMVVFLTNRHAFCNYYQLVFLLLLSSIFFGSFTVTKPRESLRTGPP